MNKPELAQALSDRTKAPKEITNDFLDALFDTITEELQKGQKVILGNFGTFYLVRHKDRVTGHPTSGEQISLPSLSLAKFRPSGSLKDAINKKQS